MGSAIEDAWDSVTGAVEDAWDDVTHNPIGAIGGAALGAIGGPVGMAIGAGIGTAADKKTNISGGISNWWKDTMGGPKQYDLSSSGSSSACGGGACAKAADETKIPAVAQSISGDAAQAVEAQGTARKRARGIMQTYTRYDSGGSGGKSKLGE